VPTVDSNWPTPRDGDRQQALQCQGWSGGIGRRSRLKICGLKNQSIDSEGPFPSARPQKGQFSHPIFPISFPTF
jgi:hypothetical protein